ncbi:MAG: hypothetical protein ABW166_08305 [Sedimenticola sp.]
MVVETVNDFNGIESVLYTKIGANIPNPTPSMLAELAVKSAKAKAGKDGEDGISYLISLKRQSISTPLMEEYEKQILLLMGVRSLEEAHEVACKM